MRVCAHEGAGECGGTHREGHRISAWDLWRRGRRGRREKVGIRRESAAVSCGPVAAGADWASCRQLRRPVDQCVGSGGKIRSGIAPEVERVAAVGRYQQHMQVGAVHPLEIVQDNGDGVNRTGDVGVHAIANEDNRGIRAVFRALRLAVAGDCTGVAILGGIGAGTVGRVVHGEDVGVAGASHERAVAGVAGGEQMDSFGESCDAGGLTAGKRRGIAAAAGYVTAAILEGDCAGGGSRGPSYGGR